MHSCSDKTELVRSGAAQHMLWLQPLQRQLHAAVWPREMGEEKKWEGGRKKRGERHLFLIPGFCRACGESSRRDRDKRKKASEQSFLQPRKEGRVSASVWLSDLQECHICGRASLLFFLAGCLWPAVSFSSFFSSLFLCRFTCLPSNSVCLDSARLQPLQINSGGWLVCRIRSSCLSFQSNIFQRKGPTVGWWGGCLVNRA